MGKRHWYAFEHVYGIEFCNDVSHVHMFCSRSERDEWVRDDPFDGLDHNFVRDAASSRRVRLPDPAYGYDDDVAFYKADGEWESAYLVRHLG